MRSCKATASLAKRRYETAGSHPIAATDTSFQTKEHDCASYLPAVRHSQSGLTRSCKFALLHLHPPPSIPHNLDTRRLRSVITDTRASRCFVHLASLTPLPVPLPVPAPCLNPTASVFLELSSSNSCSAIPTAQLSFFELGSERISDRQSANCSLSLAPGRLTRWHDQINT